ncbi:hypothetical protein N7490_001502 [Penicillium lividum]|nr:hypothetical protein N7490_001502 [Penicillium lividum]
MSDPRKRPSRATTACAACRSRKQKCSGEKPVCGQCLEYNRPCKWPEHLKRGPAKGYVEALEHRLQVTESVLFKLLSDIPDSQLKASFPENAASRRECATSYVPLARIEKKGIDHWSLHPLDTAKNIRNWQLSCTGYEKDDSSNPTPSEVTDSPIDPQTTQGTQKNIENTKDPAILGHDTSFTGQHQLHQFPDQPQDTNSQNVRWEVTAGREEASFEGISTNSAPAHGESPLQTSTFWDGAPSVNFQQQFLW